VVQYLSDEWMTEAAAALEPVTLEVGADSGDVEDVVVQYEVTAAPGGKAAYALVLSGDHLALEPGGRKDATASFTLDYQVAAEIARGELSPQAAFMQGRLKLGGDVMVLVRHQDRLAGIDDALADLRARTEY
jgi:hypothetical protein